MSSPLLEVRHLRLVRALAEEGGPTRAATRLHITQSAVSHQLAELEGRLGVPLFARVRRRLTPTAAGARLVEESRVLLGELARVERELHRAGERKRTALRVVVETFTNYHWLPRVAAELARDSPHIDLRVHLDATREPVAALLEGAVDVAIVSSPVRDRTLVATPLFDDEWMIVAPPRHRFASQRWVTVNDLAGEMLFTHDAPRSDIERLRSLISAERARMPRVTTVPLTDLIVEYVKAGAGVGLLSRWVAIPFAASGEIVCRRFTRAGVSERWVALARRDTKAPEVPRFIEIVRALASEPKHGGRPARNTRAAQR